MYVVSYFGTILSGYVQYYYAFMETGNFCLSSEEKLFFGGGKKIHFHFKVKGMFSSMLEPVTVVIANKIVFRI